MTGRMLAALLLLGTMLAAKPAFAQDPPTLVLEGTLTSADHESYRELPFDVPEGVRSITVEFEYGGREDRTTVDLGLRGPGGFRGWSGGNKSRFTVGESDATPSYLAGPISPGRWHLILGIPNIRDGVNASYKARIFFDAREQGFAASPLSSEVRWYRGDFHAHTAHSDGSCENPAKERVPCPLSISVANAAERDLDFLAITEHNTTSHHGPMRELQPFYPELLLIPGRELTTFYGHANLFGPTGFVDFQLGSARAPQLGNILDQVEEVGGIVSINHPAAPSGEACMGCGWTVPDTDWSRIAAIEVVNGGSIRAAGGIVESPISGIPFWHSLLNRGHRLTAIGGSDNHDALMPQGQPQAIGTPATWVHSEGLSVPAILNAIGAGRVFIDLAGEPGKRFDFRASAGGTIAHMGGMLDAPAGTEVRFIVETAGIVGTLEIVGPDGSMPLLVDPAVGGARRDTAFVLRSDGTRSWVRINIRDDARKLVIIGNPIYLNWQQ